MTDAFDIGFKILCDDKEFKNTIDQDEKKASGFAGKIGGFFAKGVGAVAKASVAAVGVVSGAIGGLAKIGFDYNTEMETYTTNFATMLGSQEAAIAKVDELKKFAASTPLSMADLSQGTQTLLAFGVASEDSTDILRQLGDIALGDSDKMQRLATAFGKATAQGKVTGDTVQQMTEAGWNPLIAITEKTGESMEEVQKRMSAGKITMDELKDAMNDVTSGSGQFAGGMEKASHTTAGLMSTLQDNAKALVGEVFQPLSDSMLGEVLPMAIDSIAMLSDSFKKDGIDGMVDAAGQILENVIGKITEYLPKVLETSVKIVESLANGIIKNLPKLIDAALGVVEMLGTFILSNLPQLIQVGIDIIAQIGSSILAALPELIPQIVDIVLKITETLINNVDLLIDGAIALILGLTEGIMNALPMLVEKIPELVLKIVEALIANAPKLLTAALQLVITLADGLVRSWSTLLRKIPELVTQIKEKFEAFKENWRSIGKNIVENLWAGLKERWNKLVQDAKDLGQNLSDTLKKLFGGSGNSNSNSSSNSSSNSYFGGSSQYQADSAYAPYGGAYTSAQPQVINVVLQGDANRIFRLVQEESAKNVRLTGQPSF